MTAHNVSAERLREADTRCGKELADVAKKKNGVVLLRISSGQRIMSNLFYISDLHLGHKNIVNWASHVRGDCETSEEHDEWIISQWNSVVGKKDVVRILGDLAFTKEGLAKVVRLNGIKHLLKGNHDTFSWEQYRKVGISKFLTFSATHAHFWISHPPIHPDELRGRFNIHGHVHEHSIKDKRYINVCVENLEGRPVARDTLSTFWAQNREES